MAQIRSIGLFAVALLGALLASCGGADSTGVDVHIGVSSATTSTYTVGGSITGLASGASMVLQDKPGSTMSVSSNGSFTFPTAIASGSSYAVTVLTQPAGQSCSVTNGNGTLASADVTSVAISCSSGSYNIGVTVTGLVAAESVVLQDNGGDNLTVSSNGVPTNFSTPVANGSTYSVTLLTQPAGEICTVGGDGTGTVTSANVYVTVTCIPTPYTVGGAVAGLLTGNSVVLQNNGTDDATVTGNGPFTFTTAITSGLNYAATVLTQPSGQNCYITNGSGTVTGANVSNIALSCSGGTYNIAVTVSGLVTVTDVVLQDNGADNLTLSSNGITTNFNTPLASGSSYSVTVLNQPSGETCTVGANGAGTVTNANINVAVACSDGAATAAAIATGYEHTCALTSAGAVLCWGNNTDGELGNGTTTASTTPLPVAGLSSGVAAISAGWYHSCALTNAGAVWCWGQNNAGQLGNGSTSGAITPVLVTGLSSGVIAISAGENHSCAVTSTGALQCWGDNTYGELGNGTTTSATTPVAVPGLSSGVTAVSAGAIHTCALTSAGAVLCWGYNSDGELGNDSTKESTVPVPVAGLASGVVVIAAGYYHSCAVTSAGAAICWGDNADGELGNSTTTSSSIPVPVTALSSGAIAIAAGGYDSCAATVSGAALCWGQNHDGQLGIGTTGNGSSTPVSVTGLSSGVVAVAAAELHNCAVTSDGAVWCWGYNVEGELGDGTNTNSATAAVVSGVGGTGLLQL